MDLPDLVQAAESAGGSAIDADPNFVSLATALHHLGQLDRYAAFRGLRRDALEELLTRCYGRAAACRMRPPCLTRSRRAWSMP